MAESMFPRTCVDALKALSDGDWTIVAGGTDLMVQRRQPAGRMALLGEKVMYLDGLEEIQYMDMKGSNLHIGSGMVLEDIMDHIYTPELLQVAIREMASPAIRHRGTLAGNIMNASPAGDSLPVLYALDAIVVVESIDEVRHIPIEDFITGVKKTGIRASEMVKEIIIPSKKLTHIYYKKVGGRKADAISKVSIAGYYQIKKGVVSEIALAIGAVAPRVVRLKELENQLIGKSVREIKDMKGTLLEAYAKEVTPIDDQRSSKVYREKVAMNLINDFYSFK